MGSKKANILMLFAVLFLWLFLYANPVQAATKPGVVKIKSYSSTANSVTIKWSPVSGASSYRVVRKGPGQDAFYTVQKGIKTTSFTDKTVVSGKKYSYRVYGANSAGLSDREKSTIITLTVKAGSGSTSSSGSAVKPTGVKLSKTSATLKAGKSFTLAATVLPTNATNKIVAWSSSNTAVATVNQSGKVTAKKAGTAYITVKTAINSKTAKCKVTVTGTTVSSASSTGTTVRVATANASAKAQTLLKQMEGTGGSKNTLYKNGKLTAIRLQDNGDGGLTIGWGVYIKYDNSRKNGYTAATIKNYKTMYGINLADSDSFVPISVCEKLFQQNVQKKVVFLRSWLTKKKITTIKQQLFDALLLQVFNSGGEGKLTPYLENLSASAIVSKIMSVYKAKNPILWWKYGKGWTNRVVATVRVAKEGVYVKHY